MYTLPPFCPSKLCIYHHKDAISSSERNTWYHKDGSYPSRLHPRVQRFVCTHCGKRFSTQTFSLDYGVKKHISYRRVFDQITSGSGVRSLARHLHVTDKVIINRIGRLARQAIALHASLRTRLSLSEDLAADGFESFTVSQYFPNNIHLAVGKESQYLYGIDYAHIRRKGRMREEQKRRRARLEQGWRAPTGDVYRSFTRLIRHIDEYRRDHSCEQVCLYTDEKREYRDVLGELSWVRHRSVPSTLPRHVGNDLFAVNYYDRELRKDMSNHTRETVEFSKDVNNAMERLWVYAAYHNYVKPYRIGNKRGSDTKTHAEMAGIPSGEIHRRWKTFFTRRVFVSTVRLSESEWYAWYRCYATPLKCQTPWYPRYAAA